MSMAINRISASGVAAMLFPVTKPGRVAKVASGGRSSASTTPTQNTSSPLPIETSSTAEQVHAGFQYTLTALSSVASTSTSPVQSNAEVQSGGIQQAGAYAHVEQQAGQALDITA